MLDHILIEHFRVFSIECRKTKTKVITLPNQKGHRPYCEPISTRTNYMRLKRSAGKVPGNEFAGKRTDWLQNKVPYMLFLSFLIYQSSNNFSQWVVITCWVQAPDLTVAVFVMEMAQTAHA